MSSEPDRPLGGEGEPGDLEMLKQKVVKVLKNCFDPEIPVNIYELGLIYDVGVKPGGAVHVKMTLTSPSCPVAETLPPEVENKIKLLMDVTSARVEVVWDPPWEPSMMSEAARLELNMM
jgi:FeS assembly SUF system protein